MAVLSTPATAGPPTQTAALPQTAGSAELDLRQVFRFPYGLYAFEEQRRFALVDSPYPPFYWLQSLQSEQLAFLLVAPQFVIADYHLGQAAREDFASIGLQDEGDPNLLVFSIVTLNGSDSSVNLQGPIILNKAQNLGRQIIVSDEHWSVRHSLLEQSLRLADA